MSTRATDLALANLASMAPLLPPGPPPAATALYAADAAKAILAPETLAVPPMGVIGPILAPITVGIVQPTVPDAVVGQFFLNTLTQELFICTASGTFKKLAFED